MEQRSPAPGLKCKVSWGILQIRTNQKIRRWRSLARVNRAKLSSEISEVSWVQFNHVESSSAVSRFLKEWTIHMAQCIAMWPKVHSHCIGDENAYFVSLKSIPVPFVIHSSGKCEYHSQAGLTNSSAHTYISKFSLATWLSCILPSLRRCWL